MESQIIKDMNGKILGYIETDDQGNKIIRDFYKKVLGYYKKGVDRTTDFYGKVVAQGDQAAMLIGMNLRK